MDILDLFDRLRRRCRSPVFLFEYPSKLQANSMVYCIQVAILLKLLHHEFILLLKNCLQLIYLFHHFYFIILSFIRTNSESPPRRPYRAELHYPPESTCPCSKRIAIASTSNSFLTNIAVKLGGFITLAFNLNTCGLLHLRQQLHHLLSLLIGDLVGVVSGGREGSLLHLIAILTQRFMRQFRDVSVLLAERRRRLRSIPLLFLLFASADGRGAPACRAAPGPVRCNGPLPQFRSWGYGHFWLKCPQLIRAHTPKPGKSSPQTRETSRLRSVSSRHRLKISPILGIPQVLPWTLKPPNAPTDWGVRPMWPWTAIPHWESAATSFLRRTPPSSLMASMCPSLITRIQLRTH